jgi:hypothetical protein
LQPFPGFLERSGSNCPYCFETLPSSISNVFTSASTRRGSSVAEL